MTDSAPAAPVVPVPARTKSPLPLSWPLVGAILLLAAAGGVLWLEQPAGRPDPAPIAYGWLAVGLLYLLSVTVTGKLGPLQAAIGADGRLSTSKFQFLVWTVVATFSYAWLYAARAQAGRMETINAIPQNVLLAMGFSIATVAGAKAITVSYVQSGRLNKPAPAEGSSTANLVAGDDDTPDLTKIQMLVWTFIAAAVYLAQVAGQIDFFAACSPSSTRCVFPDIDPALMVLMGLGQGAYLGNKLVTVDTPRITGSTPAAGGWGTEVKLTGEAFGTTPQWVTINDVQVPVDATKWKDGEIAVAIPRKRPSDGGDWQFHETVQLGVVVNGRRGVGAAPFQIAPPAIDSIAAVKDAEVTQVTLTGSAFGAGQGDSRILLNDVVHQVDVVTWKDGEIVFKLPADVGKTDKQVRVRIQIYGKPGPTEKAFKILE